MASKGNKALDCDTGGSNMNIGALAEFEKLQLGHRLCQIGDGIIVYHRRTALGGITGETDDEFFQLCEWEERAIVWPP